MLQFERPTVSKVVAFSGLQIGLDGAVDAALGALLGRSHRVPDEWVEENVEKLEQRIAQHVSTPVGQHHAGADREHGNVCQLFPLAHILLQSVREQDIAQLRLLVRSDRVVALLQVQV